MNVVLLNTATQDQAAVPEGWMRVPVSQLIEKHFCGPSPDCEERQVVSSDEWGVLKTTAITWDGWDETAHKVLPQAYWGRTDIQVRKGDILVTKAGPRDRVAVVVEVTSEPQNLIVSGKMIGLRLRSNVVLPQVLTGALSLSGPQKYIQARTTGMAESQVNFANTVLLETEVCIPPLIEQTHITAILDAVDAMIAQTEAVTAKLEQMRAGLFHDLLTRGLDEHGRLRDPVARPEQFRDTDLGQIPREWETLTLEQLTDPHAPICYGIVQVHDYVADGVFVLAIRDILGDYMTGLHKTAASIDANYARSRVRPGDVLISIKGTIGRIGLVPSYYIGNISRDLARIRPGKLVVPEYLVHLLRSPLGQKTLERAQVGTTRAELSIAPLKQLKFALPPVSEQKIIAEMLNGQDNLIAKYEREREIVHQLKSGLMTDLLTGRVRVPEVLGQTARCRP